MKKNWYVANDKGDLAGHDMDEYSAKNLEKDLREDEPKANWEALCEDDLDY